MKRLLQTFAVTVAVLPACHPRPAPLQAIGPDGGMVTSADGRLTVAVPRGALAGEVLLTIGLTQDAGDVCYELGPRGTDFRVPVVVTYEAPVRSRWSVLALDDQLGSQLCPRSTTRSM